MGTITLCFTIDLFAAIIIGILAGYFTIIYYLFLPIVLLFKTIPTMAIILLSLIWLKSEVAPLFVCTLVVFPLMYSNIVEGIQNVDKKLVEMIQFYNISYKKRIIHFYIPSIMPYLFAARKACFG